jgi:hypothetical protein
MMREEITDKRQEPEPIKKKYSKPQLTEYGDLAKLTQGGGGGGNDGGSPTMTCL